MALYAMCFNEWAVCSFFSSQDSGQLAQTDRIRNYQNIAAALGLKNPLDSPVSGARTLGPLQAEEF